MTTPDAPAASAPARRHSGRRRAWAAFGATVQGRAAAAVSRPRTWIIFVGLMFALPMGRAMTRTLPPQPPVLTTVPAFTLTNENGDTRAAEQLRGRIWIAEFMALDRLPSDGARAILVGDVQHRLRNMGQSAQIMSISVAPEVDTPARLYDYARAHHANPYVWNFFTGASAELHEALSALNREQDATLLAGSTLVDNGYFVLVDPDLHVRGFYPPTPDGIDALILDCAIVANLYRPPQPSEGIAS